MIDYQTRTRDRAISEAEEVIESLADLIADLDEQLAEARARLGALEEQAADLGAQMFTAHDIASSPTTPNGQASEAVAAFHRAARARRVALSSRLPGDRAAAAAAVPEKRSAGVAASRR